MLDFEIQLHGSLNGGNLEHIDTIQSDKPTQEELNYMMTNYQQAFGAGWEFVWCPVAVNREGR